MKKTILILTLTLICLAAPAFAQTTAFTYQGKLTDGANSSPTGTYDLRFSLDTGDFLVSCNGAATVNNICQDISVAGGIFTVRLDFGAAAFSNGAMQSLGIGVRRGDETGAFTPLAPAQPITSAPYAIQSLNAAQLGGVAASNIARRDGANTFAGNQTVNGDLAQTGAIADLNLTNGFVVRGTISAGAIPVTGAGARIMFYPRKAAFRSGTVTGSQWDDANIGDVSTALGRNTIASGDSSIALGFSTTASGDYSTALGFNTIASGNNSTALGINASTNNQFGSFVYGDLSTSNLLNATAINQFSVRAAGGYRLFSNAAMTSGVSLSAGGGSWSSLSDRNAKENFGAVNSRDILRKVINLPISTWSYKGQSYRHIGAMAQDFYTAFAVGENDRTITTIDPDGVALAAIQGLHEELTDRDRKIEAQQRQIEEQRENLNDLQNQVKRQQTALTDLKKLVCSPNAQAEFCREEK